MDLTAYAYIIGVCALAAISTLAALVLGNAWDYWTGKDDVS